MTSENMSLFRQTLRDNRYRLTKARETAFKLLNTKHPQTVAQLKNKAGGTIDRVSLYRSIALFEKLGLVHRVKIGWKYKLELSDQFMAHHHHLNCLGCGMLIDIGDEPPIAKFVAKIARQFDFEAQTHHFEIDGYCKKCQAT